MFVLVICFCYSPYTLLMCKISDMSDASDMILPFSFMHYDYHRQLRTDRLYNHVIVCLNGKCAVFIFHVTNKMCYIILLLLCLVDRTIEHCLIILIFVWGQTDYKIMIFLQDCLSERVVCCFHFPLYTVMFAMSWTRCAIFCFYYCSAWWTGQYNTHNSYFCLCTLF